MRATTDSMAAASVDTNGDLRAAVVAYIFKRLWGNMLQAVFIVDIVVKVFGFLCNVFSFLIFYRSNLKSPSNILVLCLTVGETMYSLRGNDIISVAQLYTKNVLLTDCGPEFYAAVSIVTVLEHIGMYASCTIVVFITVDRCLAVMLPLRYPRVVTSRRVWIASALAFLVWIPYNILIEIVLSLCTMKGASVEISQFCASSFVVELQSTFIVVLRQSQERRVKLVAGPVDRRSSLRTTKLLLVISIAFAVVYGYSFLIYVLGNDRDIFDYWLITVMDYSRFVLIDINSMCNFLVYVLGNTKFRRTFLNWFAPGCLVRRERRQLMTLT